MFHSDQGSRVHRPRVPRRLRTDRYHPVDGPARIGLGHASHRIVALHPGVRAAQREHFPTKAQAQAAVAAFVDDYNRNRRHSSLAMRSPIDYELGLDAHDRRSDHPR